MYSDEESQGEDVYVNYKVKYRELKKHLRALINENECFQDELKKAQTSFLTVTREKNYLLDRILRYEKPIPGSSDSEQTESSEDEDSRLGQSTPVQTPMPRKKITKRKRSEADLQNGGSNQSSDSFHAYAPNKITKPATPKSVTPKQAHPRSKQKRPPTARKPSVKRSSIDVSSNNQPMPKLMNHHVERPHAQQQQLHMGRVTDFDGTHKFEFASDSQMTREDIERRLEARRYVPKLDLKTTDTVPAELFSQDAGQESDVDDSEICDYIPMEDDGASADLDTILE